MSEFPSNPPTLPAVKTSPLAIWSLVLGILGVLLLLVCIGPLFAIPSVICGHIAHSRIKRSGGTLAGSGLALGGLITGYISIALSVFMIPMLMAIAVPNFVKARKTAQMNACINNLRQIDGAKQQWALENKKENTDTPTQSDVAYYLRDKQFPACLAGGVYTINAVGESPTCSIEGHQLPDN
jgi:competence protein ComGC